MTEQNFHHDGPKWWHGLTDQQRYTLIDHLFITHHRILPLFDEFERVAGRSCESEMRIPYCIALFGEPGVGKTAVLRHWMKTASAQSQEVGHVPYLYTNLSVHPTYKGLLAAWLAVLNDPFLKHGTTWSMEERLRHLIKAYGIQLLLIDHLEQLAYQEARSIRNTCLDRLEHLICSIEISSVFSGHPETAGALLRGSRRLSRRLGVERFLCPFEWDRQQPGTIREFRMLLRAIDQRLPLDLSGLDEEENAYRIFYATDGNPGQIFRLICLAAQKAVHTRADTLTGQLLAEAYDELITSKKREAQKEQVNPFSIPGFHEM